MSAQPAPELPRSDRADGTRLSDHAVTEPAGDGAASSEEKPIDLAELMKLPEDERFSAVANAMGIVDPTQWKRPSSAEPTLQTANELLGRHGIASIEVLDVPGPLIAVTNPGFVRATIADHAGRSHSVYLDDSKPGVDGESVSAYSPLHRKILIRGTENGFAIFDVTALGGIQRVDTSPVIDTCLQKLGKAAPLERREIVKGCAFSRNEAQIILRLVDKSYVAFAVDDLSPATLTECDRERLKKPAREQIFCAIDGGEPFTLLWSEGSGRLEVLKPELTRDEILRDVPVQFQAHLRGDDNDRIGRSVDGRWIVVASLAPQKPAEEPTRRKAGRSRSPFDDPFFQDRTPTNQAYLIDLASRRAYDLGNHLFAVFSSGSEYLCVRPLHVSESMISRGNKRAPEIFRLGDEVLKIDTQFLSGATSMRAHILGSGAPAVLIVNGRSQTSPEHVIEVPTDAAMRHRIAPIASW